MHGERPAKLTFFYLAGDLIYYFVNPVLNVIDYYYCILVVAAETENKHYLNSQAPINRIYLSFEYIETAYPTAGRQVYAAK